MLVGHPFSDAVIVKIPHGVNVLLHYLLFLNRFPEYFNLFVLLFLVTFMPCSG